jgi:hypothetical protein
VVEGSQSKALPIFSLRSEARLAMINLSVLSGTGKRTLGRFVLPVLETLSFFSAGEAEWQLEMPTLYALPIQCLWRAQ